MSERVINVKAKPRAEYDVFIGRPSKWGNPFHIGRDGTREEVIVKYAQWIRGQDFLLRAIHDEIEGMTLGCYCAPEPCHGDVLVMLAQEHMRADLRAAVAERRRLYPEPPAPAPAEGER